MMILSVVQIIHIQENIKVVLIINLVKKKDAVYEFIKSILNDYNYCRKVINKCFL